MNGAPTLYSILFIQPCSEPVCPDGGSCSAFQRQEQTVCRGLETMLYTPRRHHVCWTDDALVGVFLSDAIHGAVGEVHWGYRWSFLLRKKRRWWNFLTRIEVSSVQERSSGMWTHWNLKLETGLNSVPFMLMGVCAAFGVLQHKNIFICSSTNLPLRSVWSRVHSEQGIVDMKCFCTPWTTGHKASCLSLLTPEWRNVAAVKGRVNLPPPPPPPHDYVNRVYRWRGLWFASNSAESLLDPSGPGLPLHGPISRSWWHTLSP